MFNFTFSCIEIIISSTTSYIFFVLVMLRSGSDIVACRSVENYFQLVCFFEFGHGVRVGLPYSISYTELWSGLKFIQALDLVLE